MKPGTNITQSSDATRVNTTAPISPFTKQEYKAQLEEEKAKEEKERYDARWKDWQNITHAAQVEDELNRQDPLRPYKRKPEDMASGAVNSVHPEALLIGGIAKIGTNVVSKAASLLPKAGEAWAASGVGNVVNANAMAIMNNTVTQSLFAGVGGMHAYNQLSNPESTWRTMDQQTGLEKAGTIADMMLTATSFVPAFYGQQAGSYNNINKEAMRLRGMMIDNYGQKGWNMLSSFKRTPVSNEISAIDETDNLQAKPVGKERKTSQENMNSIPKEEFIIKEPTSNTLQLKSTMLGSPLEKQLSKDGFINIKSLESHLNNPSTSAADKIMIQKIVDEKFPGQVKINYNELRQAISEELIPLKKDYVTNYANYGLGRIGYNEFSKDRIYQSIGYAETLVRDFFLNRKQYGIDAVKSAIRRVREERALLKDIPERTTSIVYSNNNKFGRGSTEHFVNEGTLGHSRILVSNEEPNVFHVLEQQSDYYQHINKNDFDPKQIEINLRHLDENLQHRKNILYKMQTEGVDNYGNQVTEQNILDMKATIDEQIKHNELTKAGYTNTSQKNLLGKTHQERFLQENMVEAVAGGQTKMRYPTRETAAKIQGYKKNINTDKANSLANEIQYLKDPKGWDKEPGNKGLISKVLKELEINGGNIESLIQQKTIEKDAALVAVYNPEHITILRKYDEMPKLIYRVTGKQAKQVPDVKGNTWYEFDIPDNYIRNKAEIKALTTIGAVAVGNELMNNNENK